jgi:nitroreductase
MKNTFIYIIVGFFCSLVTACVAAPQKQQKKPSLREMAKAESNTTSAIKQRREQQFAQMLASLQRRNPEQEARNAIARGDLYVMGYNLGIGGLSIPGINVQQNRCRVQQLDGLGDVIYGDKHMQYIIAAKRFANRFNQVMLPYCR